jgi:hypothetical protein
MMLNTAVAGQQGEQALVLSHLEDILRSKQFCNSARCQDLLRYLVIQRLKGHAEELKERVIGVEVFGRSSDYNTGEDAVVRVKTSEVRRRLAEYYNTVTPPPLRIEFPARSYSLDFVVLQQPDRVAPQAISPLRSRAHITFNIITIAVLGGILAVTVLAAFLWPHEEFQLFWRPFAGDSHGTLLIVPDPVRYSFSQRIHINEIADELPSVFTKADVIPLVHQDVGSGDAAAAAKIAAVLGELHASWHFQLSSQSEFNQLRHNSVILVGAALSNGWSGELGPYLRYIVTSRDGRRVILDQSKPERMWYSPDLRADGKTSKDYAVISRWMAKETGEVILETAGIATYGTAAAAEFVTDRKLLNAALRKLPKGWANGNLQFIVETQVIHGVSGPPRMIEYAWSPSK